MNRALESSARKSRYRKGGVRISDGGNARSLFLIAKAVRGCTGKTIGVLIARSVNAWKILVRVGPSSVFCARWTVAKPNSRFFTPRRDISCDFSVAFETFRKQASTPVLPTSRD